MITRLLGLIIISTCLAVVYLFENTPGASESFRVFHWPAMVLTGIGPIGLLLLCSDWTKISSAFRTLLSPSRKRSARLHDEEAEYLHGLSQRYYVMGSRAFDSKGAAGLSPHLRKVLRRLAMRMPVIDVRHLLERDQEKLQAELYQQISVLGLGVRLSPSMGMLGTILGMVKLLSSLKDPSNIGSHMGLALLTTFYGLFFSLVFWTPLEQSLQNYLDSELRGIDQTLHWLELLEHRKPAQYFAEDDEAPVQPVAVEAGVKS